ncbi:hypothetical protein WN944_026330 [Citrus x changshan-huyou]|uniref:Uncharacterized protein n=1 Tax=Citrus x changshan-huyou TaxID=2935761 RepID=A0AAP0LRU3_9ROSI
MQGIKSLYGAGAAFDPLDSACLNPTFFNHSSSQLSLSMSVFNQNGLLLCLCFSRLVMLLLLRLCSVSIGGGGGAVAAALSLSSGGNRTRDFRAAAADIIQVRAAATVFKFERGDCTTRSRRREKDGELATSSST